ncbi:tyrosine-type recombinase/integrase [Thiomicrorhabdus cannonii]|uniref:tyrosine-type recombinase/integrase n=1 Tax=Thiomicrorhabdus cannonii TaxID=2748011 RepID=UPI0015BD23E2|nr:tyrosine-type recombinase/integrase [Thiomicrorhabdus cannonii]
MPLTDTQIKKTKANGKVQKLNDGGGLRLEISKAGSKAFKYRIRMQGKDTDITLGLYPAMSLAEARAKRDEVKAMVKQGIDPIQQRNQLQKEQKAIEQAQAQRLTFQELFAQWFKQNAGGWSYDYQIDTHNRITQHLLPTLGEQFIDEVTPQQVIHALKTMEAKGLGDSLHKVKQYASRIFRFGVGLGLCPSDPVRDIPSGDIFKKQTKKNFHHLTKTSDLHQLLNAIDLYVGDISTSTALKLAPHVFLRPSELAGLRWDEVDLNKDIIIIPAERMKMKRPHMVPLSRQAKAIIETMLPFKHGTEYVFPSPRSPKRPMCKESLNAALHRLGFKGKQTAHGFRHTASTLLHEMGYTSDYIEKQLAHEQDNEIKGAYNKAEYLTQRVEIMQAWSDHLDALKAGADVIPIHKNAGK